MFVNVTLKKWGNSLGLVVPSDLVEKLDLKENQQIRVNIEDLKANLAKELWGAIKLNKSPQELKDEARTGWD